MPSVLRIAFLEVPMDIFNYERVGEVALRTAIVYLALLAGMRVAGKREVGQMKPFDLVTLLIISNAVQNAMVGPDVSLIGGLAAAGVLLLVNFVVVRLVGRGGRAERFLEGVPTLLVKDGAFVDQALRHEGLAPDEVMMAVREHGIDDVRAVRAAYLEPDGTISVIPMDAKVFHGKQRVPRIRQFRRGTG
jgi:uncharacterized membrane protein YcaP (DUF421 family)